MDTNAFRYRVKVRVGVDGTEKARERMVASGEFADVRAGSVQVYGTIAVPNNREPDGYVRAVCSYVLGFQLTETEIRKWPATGDERFCPETGGCFP